MASAGLRGGRTVVAQGKGDPDLTGVDAGSIPRLARGVRLRFDRISGKTLLLRPEQGFELQGSALEIIQLLARRLTVGDIVVELVGRHQSVSPQEIAVDVQRLLEDLSHRGVIAFGDGDGDTGIADRKGAGGDRGSK